MPPRAFRNVAKYGESASERAEGLWRVGWVQYRTARYAEAAETFKMVAEAQVGALEPQALYWLARASDQDKKGKDPNQIVCDKQEVLGSRVATKKVCMTRAEWAERRHLERQEIDRAQTARGSCEGCQ